MHERYYIGLGLPSLISAHIVRVQKELYDPETVIKPLEPHITMLPPPAVSKADPAELAARCKAAAEPFWPLRLTLTAIGTFRGRAVFIDVNGGYIHKLQQRLTELLPEDADARYYPDPSFHPHVTLSQAIHGKHLPGELAGEYAARLGRYLPRVFEVGHLMLYRSTGPRAYTAEQI